MDTEKVNDLSEKLKPIHEKKKPPGTYDWMAQHHEPGQDFKQYLRDCRIKYGDTYKTIYILPIGEFSPEQQEIVNLSCDYIAKYFCIPVKKMDSLPLEEIPASAQRVHPSWGDEQLLTSYILSRVLKPKRPDDAVAVIGITAADLWPGAGWNFVFGQASYVDRVGVWSIYRNGDPEESPEMFRRCLRRTINTAAHEIGHILGMAHCIYYECDMNGSNHMQEKDSRPLALCPDCLKKLLWNTGCDPAQRFNTLSEFCTKYGLTEDAELFEKSGEIIGEE